MAPKAAPTDAEITELDDSTFEDGTVGAWTIVDFWAAWCGPCRMFQPVFDETARTWTGVRFARCNVDASPRTAHAWGIASIPTISLFDPSGNEVERLVGVPRYREGPAIPAPRCTRGARRISAACGGRRVRR